jgi:hypothetical protein
VEHSDWIDSHGAQRRDIADGECDGGQHDGNSGEGGKIVWRDTVEKTSHERSSIGEMAELS